MPAPGHPAFHRVTRLLLGACFLIFLMCHGRVESAIVPRPADAIEDDSRLLNAEARSALAAAIARAAEADLRVGFAAMTMLPGTAIAGEMKESWFPGDARAVMIVYARDRDQFFVADAREKDPLFHGFAAQQAVQRANGVLARLNRDIDGRDPVIAGEATRLVLAFADSARATGMVAEPGEAARMIAMWVGAAAMIGLPIYLLLRGGRKTGAVAHPSGFPEVAIPPRLGATNGGILGAELNILEDAKRGDSSPEESLRR